MKLKTLAAAALALCLAASACDTQQYAAGIGDFGTASATVIQQTKDAYKLVNDTVLQQQILALTARSSPITTDPVKEFPPFLPEEDLTIRGTLLDGLQAYASALGSLTGKAKADLDTETAKLAGSLKDLGKNDRLQHSFRETKSISPEAFNAAATGVEAIGNFLIDRKIARDLPAILTKTEPTIEAIAALFIHEIGDVPASNDPGGLRGKLWRTYNSLIEQQTFLVNRNDPGSAEKQQNVARLAALVAAQKNADAGLAGTQAALRKLIASHQALLRVQTAPATFKTVIASLWAEAKAAQDFYAKLPAK